MTPFRKESTLVRTQPRSWRQRAFLSLGYLITITLLMPASSLPQSSHSQPSSLPAPTQSTSRNTLTTITDDETTTRIDTTRSLSPKQMMSIVQANFAKTKNDATELAAVAKALREELNRPNANILSSEVHSRLERIEKLAKKIREQTKGY